MPTPTSIEASSLTDLVRIFDPDVQLCFFPRQAPPELAAFIARRASDFGSGMRTLLRPGSGFDLSALGNIARPPSNGRFEQEAGLDLLREDIAFLSELLGELLGCPEIAARIEVIERAMCPRFHVDHTGIRLLCTYRGPGTEWLDDADADRSKLGAGNGGLPDHESGIMKPDAVVHSIPEMSIALLKGDLWQGNAGRGAIHRSPAIATPEAPRILLAMDPVWGD